MAELADALDSGSSDLLNGRGGSTPLIRTRFFLIMPKDFLAGVHDEYDCVVIGGGLAGMTSANILGRAGHRVLLLEQHYKFGGLATWFRRPGGHIFDISLHGFPYASK